MRDPLAPAKDGPYGTKWRGNSFAAVCVLLALRNTSSGKCYGRVETCARITKYFWFRYWHEAARWYSRGLLWVTTPPTWHQVAEFEQRRVFERVK